MQVWPDKSNLLATFNGLYDWDEVSLLPGSLNILPFTMRLCTGDLPCSISLMGHGNASLYLSSAGKFVCNGIDGCTKIEANSVRIKCMQEFMNTTLFSISDAEIVLNHVQVERCRIDDDGGVIQASKKASAIVTDSSFENIHSSGFGGVFSLVGSALDISTSIFINCSAKMGGAISALDYQCSQTPPTSSEVQIDASYFYKCTSEGRGGAAYLGSGRTDIRDSTFTECKAQQTGGAIYSTSGSASAFLTVTNCTFLENEATDSGGGALHTSNVNVVLAGSKCSGNRALNGGGGAILWEASPVELVCGVGAYRLNDDFECDLCPAGKYQSGIGMTSIESCSYCGAGSFAVEGASSCTQCPPGKYSSAIAAGSESVCLDCFPGSYQGQPGMVSSRNCSLCSRGTFNSVSGASSCLRCGAGTYSIGVGSASNSSCSHVCPAGSYSSAGASSCTGCRPGTFSTGEVYNSFLPVSSDCTV
jgi:uncharacterized Zn-binding protein involved in type VI secretion